MAEEQGTPNARELAVLVAVRLWADAFLIRAGFRALSDDDYSRVVIAERFAHSASFDPSGTSWLPLPFWVYGAALRVFDGALSVARVTASVLGVLATLALFVAGRWLGASRRGALLGAALGTLCSYSMLLGVATVPEVPCAALIVLGMASLASHDRSRRLLGALAIAAACASRYEAWPVACVLAALNARDVLSGRRELWPAALVALGFPLLWMSYGALHHGSPVFFVTRVAAYRRALGPSVEPLWQSLLGVPFTFATAPSAAVALLLLGIVPGRVTRKLPRGPLWAGAALLAFLIAGRLSDGVPTHHAERVLLPLWFLLALLAGDHAAQLVTRSRGGITRLILLALGVACALSVAHDYQTALDAARHDRREEVELGQLARQLGVQALGIDTRDYGFFAVMAAFGDPAHAAPLDDRDPRHERAPDLFADAAAFERYLLAKTPQWLIVSREHWQIVSARCHFQQQRAGLALVSCRAP